MSITIETKGLTRVSDLDTQRHVTSVTYEHLALDGRHRVLEEAGFPITRMLEEGLVMRPLTCRVRFLSQQMAGAELTVQTAAHPKRGGRTFWQHVVRGPAHEDACRLDVETVFEKNGRARQILPVEKGTTESLGKAPMFSGGCKRVESHMVLRFFERDIFGCYPLSQYWRIAEEGRWALTEALGINLETIRKTDTTMFWMGGSFFCHRMLPERARVRSYTWVRRIEGIRAYFRQQFVLEDTGEVVLDTDEEQLIVSLSRARPKRATPEFIQTFADYLEER